MSLIAHHAAFKIDKAPERITARCSLCGAPERKKKIIPVQLSRGPVEYSYSVEFACEKCRRKMQGRWRVPSYVNRSERGGLPRAVYACQLVPEVRTISIQQPWAWLLAHGFKDVENRSRFSNFTGRIFIHASKAIAPNQEAARRIAGNLGIEVPPVEYFELRAGTIVGVARFGRMAERIESPWKSPDGWAWPVEWAWPLDSTEIVRGNLGIWQLPTDNLLFEL